MAEGVSEATKAISSAQVLLIGAGAGMGAESGLETYRTREEFWKFYPQLKHLDKNIPEMSNSKLFLENPALAWGFYGTRFELYKKTQPHAGYSILKNWANKMAGGYFIFTSNVDGHFAKAGFDEDYILERHGSINHLQCTDVSLSEEVWPSPENLGFSIDPDTLLASGNLPQGPPGHEQKDQCLARPNLVFFNDDSWVTSEVDKQEGKLLDFVKVIKDNNLRFVIVEIGAGATIQTVRGLSEYIIQDCQGQGTLIRINPMEPEVPEGQGHIPIKMKGLIALVEIDECLRNIKKGC